MFKTCENVTLYNFECALTIHSLDTLSANGRPPRWVNCTAPNMWLAVERIRCKKWKICEIIQLLEGIRPLAEARIGRRKVRTSNLCICWSWDRTRKVFECFLEGISEFWLPQIGTDSFWMRGNWSQPPARLGEYSNWDINNSRKRGTQIIMLIRAGVKVVAEAIIQRARARSRLTATSRHRVVAAGKAKKSKMSDKWTPNFSGIRQFRPKMTDKEREEGELRIMPAQPMREWDIVRDSQRSESGERERRNYCFDKRRDCKSQRDFETHKIHSIKFPGFRYSISLYHYNIT